MSDPVEYLLGFPVILGPESDLNPKSDLNPVLFMAFSPIRSPVHTLGCFLLLRLFYTLSKPLLVQFWLSGEEARRHGSGRTLRLKNGVSPGSSFQNPTGVEKEEQCSFSGGKPATPAPTKLNV